jgi:hypothetical protein
MKNCEVEGCDFVATYTVLVRNGKEKKAMKVCDLHKKKFYVSGLLLDARVAVPVKKIPAKYSV